MTRLMDINELATYLKVEKQTIYNWLHKGKISGIKMGHVWRFDKKAVDAWLKSHLREAKGEAERAGRSRSSAKGEGSMGL